MFFDGHFEFLINMYARSASSKTGTEMTEIARSLLRALRKLHLVTLLFSVSNRILQEFESPRPCTSRPHTHIKNLKWPPQNMHNKGSLIFYSYSKWMWGLPVFVLRFLVSLLSAFTMIQIHPESMRNSFSLSRIVIQRWSLVNSNYVPERNSEILTY